MSVIRPGSYLTGCAMVLLAGLVLSLGIICIRSTSGSDAWQYQLWRGIGFALAMSVVAALRHARNPLRQVRALSRLGWLSVAALAASQIAFVASIKAGNTAEMFFLMSLSPLVAAALAWPLIGERVGAWGLVAIAIALAGVGLMSGLGAGAGADAATPGASLAARALALTTAVSFALYSLATRGARAQDLDAALVAVGMLTAGASLLAVLWLGLALVPSPRDVLLALLHGAVILAAGLFLFARGSRVVPGVTLVLLAQVETVAAPLWTWLLFGETTTRAVLAGGALILLGVILQAAGAAPSKQVAAPRAPAATGD